MTTPAPDYSKSWDFLNLFHPGRLRVVTAVNEDKTKIPTETFSPDQRAEFMRWVEACGRSSMNVYFSVGEPMARAQKKLERTDIKAVHWLHVDVDPRVGEDLDKERDRILKLLRTPPGGLPSPTAIVYSGGGYQGYWRLKEPLVVNGVLDTAVDLAYYNVQIERLLGADNCHDVSRIMRVPGTINLPNAKKRKRGQTPVLSEVVEFHLGDDHTYPILKFVKAQGVQTAADSSPKGSAAPARAPRIKAPANVKRLSDVRDLGDKVSNSVKVYIVQGKNPDEPNHFASRSEMLFWVVCELVRSGVDDDTIYSVLTDKEFRISESVLEKGTGAERYALRQIERAREDAVDPMLRQLNDRHAVIENVGGRCVVIEEVWDDVLERFTLTRQGFDHFRNRYMNKRVVAGTDAKGNPQEMPAGEWWLRHGDRRQYARIVFAPGRDVADCYNLWRGFGCEARAGDCSLYLNHLRDIVCSGNVEHFEYLIGWMANTVQHPAFPGNSAIIMRGRQGCGKSIAVTMFGRLFGRHYIMVNRREHLVGNFNSHLQDCVLLFAEEAFFAGDKQNENVLKTIVTERMLAVERKGIDTEMSANCVHLMMASNEKWVVPAGYDDRRYFVLDVSSDRVGDQAYFDAMIAQMESGGYEALLHHLLTYDLTKFNVRKVPKTEALNQQKALSMESDAEWWLSILRRGTLLPNHDGWRDSVAVDHLAAEFSNYMRHFNVNRRGNSTRLGLTLGEVLPSGVKRYQRRSPIEIHKPDGSKEIVPKPWHYSIPPLADCRKHFDQHFGGPYRWDADLPEEDVPDYGSDGEPLADAF